MLGRKLILDMVAVQAFECAARHGSFTRAAAELSLTQSAVSRQIKDLESRLGAQLFERIRQRVVLSQDGRRLLPQARRLLQQTEDIVLRTMSAADARLSLSVATLPTFGSRWLSPRLAKFLTLHPGTVLNVGSRSATFEFEEEDFDLAIHYGKPVWARGICTYLCSELIVPVAGGALMGQVGHLTPSSLLARPLLHLATRPKLWQQWFETVGVVTDRAYRGHRFDQFSMIVEAAIGGMGYALLPRYLIERELASGDLMVVFDAPMETDNSYYVVVPEAKSTNALARDFIEWLLAEIGAKNG